MTRPKNGYREDCHKLCDFCFWYDEEKMICERDIEEPERSEEVKKSEE